MTNSQERFPFPANSPEKNQESEPVAEEDKDIEDYENNLDAQHKDADKIYQDQRDENEIQKHEREIFDERIKNSDEDKSERNKQYRLDQKL